MRKYILTLIVLIVTAISYGRDAIDLEEYVMLAVTTTDFDSGDLFTSTPRYTVYEMNASNGTISNTPVIGPILLVYADHNSETGLHLGSFLAGTAVGTGFLVDNTYAIFYEANVNGKAAGFVETFRVRPAPLATQAQADRNAYLNESQRGYHTFQGDLFYVDPINGDTHANGNRGSISDPYLTIQDCHDNAVTAWAHDVIILIAGDTNSNTTHTVAATTTLSKAYTFIRGPGRDFIITRTGNGDTIAITADGIEISGVQIGTAATGSGDGIDIIDSDFTRVRHCWFLDTRGDGIHILRGNNGQYHNNHFEGTGVNANGQGIHIVGTSGTSNENMIYNNHFSNTQGDSILIEDGTTIDTSIHHNQIHDSVAWGINIGASSVDALVHDNFFGNNASGNINDNGATTVAINNEQWAHWDALLTASNYNIPTSAGRRLRAISSSVIITGTSPGTANTSIRIELNGDASSDDGAYDPSVISIVAGTGLGQSRQIWEYVGATKLAYINREWKTIPDNTSEYVITGDPGLMHVNEGLAQGGSANTIILNTIASSEDNAYHDQVVFIPAGVGQDQIGIIISYAGDTRTATVEHDWEIEPTNESMYAILPLGVHTLAEIGEQIWITETSRTLTSGGGGDATLAGQQAILDRGNSYWLTGAGSTPADMYTDITTRPWEEVYHEIGDPDTEYYREALYSVRGTPIVSSGIRIGMRVRQ